MTGTTSPGILSRTVWATLVGLVGTLCFYTLLLVVSIGLLRNDLAKLEWLLEAAASWALEREVEIGQVVEAELNWDAYLLATDVRLANPGWAAEPDFMHIERLLIRVNLPSIWSDGPILVEELQVTQE